MKNELLFDFGQSHEHESYLGTVIQVDTRRVVINAADNHLERASIGRLVALPSNETYLIGLVDRIVRQSLPTDAEEDPLTVWKEESTSPLLVAGNAVTVTLVGRVFGEPPSFSRSLMSMPGIGRDCFVLKESNLKAFMGLLGRAGSTEHALAIGRYALDTSAPAYLDGNRFFQRHAALLGSTGSGKSWTVATILERAAQLPSANLIVFDLHGEYGELQYVDHLRIPGPDELTGEDQPSLLYLPYWLMNADELISMFIDNSEFSAHNQTLVFQNAVVRQKTDLLNELGRADVLGSFTVDSPVPFSLDAVVGEIKRLNEQMVQGARGPKKGDFNGQFSRLLARMSAKLHDRRYGFLFNQAASLHTYEAFHALAAKLLDFAESCDRKRIKVIDFSEVPADVLPVMLGIVARLIYYLQFWMPHQHRHPVAVVCDEAHLYLPRENANPLQRRAAATFKKIAKEGRKYGVSLVVVSQRPSDVDATILSQCNNVVTLRLTNTGDIGVVRGLMPDNMSGLVEILPTLDIGEALMIGDATLLPSRVIVTPPTEAPRSATIDFWTRWSQEGVTPNWSLAAENMRRQNRRQQ